MTQAVIFDMDGVLIDSERYIGEIERDLLKKYGIDLTEAVHNEYLGFQLKPYIQALEKRFNKKVPFEDFSKDHKEKLAKYYEEIIPLMPHVLETLQALQPKYKLGIATSRERYRVEIILKRLAIGSFFQASTCAEEVAKGKPDPEVYLKTAFKLGIDPKNCVAVEDGAIGMQSAKSAGMKVIGYKAEHNKNIDFSLADTVVSDLLEIPPLSLLY